MKSIRRVLILAAVLALALQGVAAADTIVSPVFQFPAVQERPTAEPQPTAEPVLTPEPEVPADPAPEAPAEPEVPAEPEPAPLPVPELSVSSNLAGMQVVTEGTEMVLTLSISGVDGYHFAVQWQQSTDGGATWTDIAGANGMTYSLALAPEHTGMYWRASVEIIAP